MTSDLTRRIMRGEEKLYTRKQVADMVKLTPETITLHIDKGYLKAMKLGRNWRIPETWLEEYLSNGA